MEQCISVHCQQKLATPPMRNRCSQLKKMKIISYSKTGFASLNMLHEKWKYDVKYEVNEFHNELRNELKNKTKFGEILLNHIDKKSGPLTKEHQKRLWFQILNKQIESEYLFLRLNRSKESFEYLLEVATELKIEFKAVLNLFLPEEKIVNRAKIFYSKPKIEESIPEGEFIQKIINREQKRLSLLNEIKGLTKIINIDADYSQAEIEAKILKEIKN